MSVCVFCSLSYEFSLLAKKLYKIILNMRLYPRLKQMKSLIFQDVEFNNVIDKGKQQCKLSYKTF